MERMKMKQDDTLADKDTEPEENRLARLMTFGHLKLYVFIPTVLRHDHTQRRVRRITLPSCRTGNIRDDYTLFSVIEPKNTFRYTLEWNYRQLEFAKTLLHEDIDLFASYSYHGDVIINQHLMYKQMLPTDKEKGAEWYHNGYSALYADDVLSYLEVHDTENYNYIVNLGHREGSKALAVLMSEFSYDEWTFVCYRIYNHFLLLFQMAPRTTQPMMLYRSESATSTSPPLVWYGEKRLISCTLDASVAAFHAGVDGIIYRIVFPPGTPTMLIAGYTLITDIEEAEVLLPPIFRFKRSGKLKPIHDPHSGKLIGKYQDCVAIFNPVFAATGDVIKAAGGDTFRYAPDRRNSIMDNTGHNKTQDETTRRNSISKRRL